ncbi:MAG: phosphoglycerate mutase family protein [Chloroflexi bacterium]|nr:phosphoglycerate mutase family protein [Chloroflexota bacterium]
MPKLLLIKHSEPVVDPELPPSKWKLSDRGIQRADLLAAYLADRSIDMLYSSSEAKAMRTAEIIGATTGLPIIVLHDLREHDRENTPVVGAEQWRSQVVESIHRQDELIYGAEPVADARKRFGKTIRKIMQPAQVQIVAVVTHGTVISTFAAEMLNIDPVPIWDSLGLPGLIEIEWPRPSKILSRRNFD